MQEETPEQNFKPLRDVALVSGFILAVILGSIFINSFIFRTFTVVGPSMEPTLHTSERLVVNKIPKSLKNIAGQEFVPERGQVVIFRNPLFREGREDEYVVKRVIGLPGERVVVADGVIKVFNKSKPYGFEPDKDIVGPKRPSSGTVEIKLSDHELFVAGDNRKDNYSLDSRNGLGAIPLSNLQGIVSLRIFPFDKVKLF